MDPAEFLQARLDEDEARAKKAQDEWNAEYAMYEWEDLPDEVFAHARTHDPARVLREVEAKRAILELAKEASGLDDTVDAEFRSGPRDTASEPYVGDRILRALATVYRDHPDYDPAWTPVTRIP